MKPQYLSAAAAAIVALGLSQPAQAGTVYNVSGAATKGVTTVTVDADPSTKNVIDPFVVTSLSDVFIDLGSLATQYTLPSGAKVTIPAITFANPVLGGFTFTGTTGAWLVGSFDHVTPGSYYLTFTSTAGISGGSFKGTVEITSVPEPTTLGLALAGMWVVGAACRRACQPMPTTFRID